MAASQSTSSTSMPQGFSVYQAALGDQLQFFPAVGTQQLDDMIHASVPGSASTQEKRATVSLDFLQYTQVTGLSFKFYPVYAMNSATESPTMASPLQDSASSSFNVSPVTPNWDWSQASVASSSRSSTQAGKSHKAGSSRQAPTDFSHLPGMQIMTKDGRDVTNSASRGSKTKEQRDHAHLMRVIKACDACRKRKTRCDPSHKKRTAISQGPSQAAAKTSKKARTTPPAPSVVRDETPVSFSPFDMDSSFSFTGLEDMDFTLGDQEPWEQFVQYPGSDLAEDYDFFLDPEGFFSPQSSLTSASSSASPSKSLSPTSQEEISDTRNSELQTRAPRPPFMDRGSTLASTYADFNLYSPQSSFSEDEFMIPIQSSAGRMAGLSPPLDPHGLPPTQPPLSAASGVTVAGNFAATQSSRGGEDGIDDYYEGGHYYDPGRQGSGDATGGSLGFESGLNSGSSSGSSIDLSMRILGEASTFEGARDQANETATLGGSSCSGPASSLVPSEPTDADRQAPDRDNVTDNVLHVEPTPGVAGRGRGVEQLPGSSPGMPRSAATTAYEAARATAVHDGPVNATGIPGTVVSATPMDVNGALDAAAPANTHSSRAMRGAVDVVSTVDANNATATDSSLEPSSQEDSRVVASSQGGHMEPVMESATTTSADVSMVPRSRQEMMGEDVVAELAIYSPDTREDASQWSREVETRSPSLVEPLTQGLVARCKSATLNSAPLATVAAMLLGVFALMLSAMHYDGTTPSLYGWGMVVATLASVTVSRYGTLPLVNAVASVRTDATSSLGIKGRCGMEPASVVRERMAALRCKVSHMIKGQEGSFNQEKAYGNLGIWLQ